MKFKVIAIIIISFRCHVYGQGSSEQIPLKDIAGKWFVTRSNFPMWLKGNKTNPTFNYTISERKNKQVLIDIVMYDKKGKRKRILGIDTPTSQNNREFTWRGKGILGILKSKWSILVIGQEKQWAIIYFKKTRFTPSGYDVISRSITVTPQHEKEIERRIDELGLELTKLKV